MTAERSERGDLIDRIAEEVADRCRHGERPTAEEYAARHPEAADEIREVFPTLLLIEDAGSDGDGREPDRSPDSTFGENFELGDYRILREIGRGGMGIVFEAEHRTLGRRVALKILPQRGLLSRRQVERFQLEARSAAQLLHPHIVSVHDVGEHEGIHYYAMQYIAGQGLDSVLRELRRVREEARDNDSLDAARTILSGSTGITGIPAKLEEIAAKAAPRPAPSSSGAAIQLLGNESSRSSRDGSYLYFRNVAQIGAQVADALAYAHEQGILHRDIKPSNLLLDLQGDVWVTDFGLAKTADAEGLTLSGDVVGTLRYMGPERFRGWSDPRSDVYSLGATLYELLTLRPLFRSVDRASLVHEVLHQEPLRPRRFDSRIPRDLETVIMKSIDKEPAKRYATAAEMRDDLVRFVEDRPIVARRSSIGQRAWLWCRRKPAVASLTAAIAVVLLSAAAISSVAAIRLRETAWESRLAQARAGRWSLQIGQRRKSLEALRAAAQTRLTQELRNEAAAALCLTDIPERDLREGFPQGVFSRDFVLYASEGSKGRTSVIRFDDGALIADLPVASQRRVFSPDGKLLACTTSSSWEVWSLDGARRLVQAPLADSATFTADSRYIVIASPAKSWAFDLETGAPTDRFTRLGSCSQVEFSPRGGVAACLRQDSVSIDLVDSANGAVLRSLTHPYPVRDFDWSEDGRILAAASQDRTAYLWDTMNGSLLFRLEGHEVDVVDVAFQPAGFLLATYSWDGHTRLWDTRSGRLVSRCEGLFLGFSLDGRRLAVWFRDALAVHDVVHRSEYWSLRTNDPGIAAGPYYADFSPDGQWIASSYATGLRLWEGRSGRLAAHAEVGLIGGVRFLPDGHRILTLGQHGLLLWPIDEVHGLEDVNASWRLGPPQVVCKLGPSRRNVSVTSDGSVAAFPHDRRPWTVRLEPPYETRSYPAAGPLFDVDISPDGHWLAGSNWNSSGVPVWSVAGGDVVIVLPSNGSAQGKFSPDGSRLFVGSTDEYVAYETGSWKRDIVVRRGRGYGSLGTPAFTPDGAIVAVQHTRTVLQLLDARTGSELLSLDTPGGSVLGQITLSRDGGTLAALSLSGQLIHFWDLRKLRVELQEIGIESGLPRGIPRDARGPDGPGIASNRVEVLRGPLAPEEESQSEQPRKAKDE